MRITTRIAVAAVTLLASACSSGSVAWVDLDETTTTRSSALMTWNSELRGLRSYGFEVDTVGGDTIVTQYKGTTARRFILEGMTGYSGRVAQDFVNLSIGPHSIWIDEGHLKFHGPDFSVDLGLDPDPSVDAFGGKDLILREGTVQTVDAD